MLLSVLFLLLTALEHTQNSIKCLCTTHTYKCMWCTNTLCAAPKLFFVPAQMNSWLKFLWRTKNPSTAPIFVHSSIGAWCPKEKPAWVGGVFLARGKWEIKVPAQGETIAHQGAAAGMSRGQGSVTRGDATTTGENKLGWEIRSEFWVWCTPRLVA